MDSLRKLKHKELIKVAEVIDRAGWVSKTVAKSHLGSGAEVARVSFDNTQMTVDQYKTVLKSGLLTYMLHCEARIASFLGKGFYTIGPCGEELMGTTSLNLKQTDLAALHYRHVANSVVRQMQDGKAVENIALDRARGYTCSSLDSVTGGRHCSIGGNFKNEFLVTSTLASQAPSALGRALAIPLSNRMLGKGESNFAPDAVSYVSLGDGSINNAHFLAAINLAKYSEHSRFKCPIVFVVSDNKKCISLKGNGWVDKFVSQLGSMRHITANGNDVFDLYSKSKEIIDFTRSSGKPSLLFVNSLARRFGHAATDRQFAYMSPAELNAEVEKDALSEAFSVALQLGVYTEAEVASTFEELQNIVEKAFDQAVDEPKIVSRDALIASNSQPLAVNTVAAVAVTKTLRTPGGSASPEGRAEPMRKHMTRVLDEILEEDKSVVYLGEDVEHGGYYLVTEGLYSKYPMRVRNFPPDETTLVGAAIGFSQAGLTPILEIPYAKYLDCAADMFYEAIIANWLSNSKQPNGMVIRLQGFDKGIFGGNFHTHNLLSLPPGLDVVCYSNGTDYVKGMRNAVKQAKAGRVVMLVDSTDLLNRRHLEDVNKDEFWLSTYPVKAEGNANEISFDDIMVYPSLKADATSATKKVVIVSYGNGLPTSLIARKAIESQDSNVAVTVIDSPCISQTPKKLAEYLSVNKPDSVVFADVCKQGAGMPLGGIAINMQNDGVLKNISWRAVGASPTYNPLGNSITFLSSEDISSCALNLLK